jgi:hypothetical protein
VAAREPTSQGGGGGGGGPRASALVLTRSSGGSSLGVAGTWCLGYRQPGMLQGCSEEVVAPRGTLFNYIYCCI